MKENLLLLHGWDYELYNNMTSKDNPWYEYSKFINGLKEKYNIYIIRFPGFCKEKEPNEEYWDIEDFSNYVYNYIKESKINFNVIVGYSFGGAVCVDLKVKYNLKAKVILIAPAIIRNNNNSKKFIKTPKAFNRLRRYIRNLYVSYIVNNPEMKYGTKFLRKTYQVIVRRDLINELEMINQNEIKIFYGTKDTAVNPYKMIEILPKKYKESIIMVEGANHDDILIKYVDNILKNMQKNQKNA